MDDYNFPERFLEEEDDAPMEGDQDSTASIDASMESEATADDANADGGDDLSGLPQKPAAELTKSEIQHIFKLEKVHLRQFVFSVTRKGSIYDNLHYSSTGGRNADLSSKPCQYVCCSVCSDLLGAKGGHLGRHEKKHSGSRTSTPVSENAKITSFMADEFSTVERSRIAGILGNYALDSGVPFRSMESEPFHKLVVDLINFGVKRKKGVTLDVVTPCRVTIATHTANLASSRVSKASDMLAPLKQHSGAISVDYGRRVDDYIAVVCHFIDRGDGWRLRALPVGFERSIAESKEAPQVWLDLLDAAEMVGLDETSLSGAFCVTDQGIERSIHCADHLLNTVSQRTFEIFKVYRGVDKDGELKNGALSKADLEVIDRAVDVLDTAQFIANNIRNMRKVVSKLAYKPTRGAETRWLSSLDVCRDVKGCLDQLVQLKHDAQWSPRLGARICDAVIKLNGLRNELDACISVLNHFEEPVKVLQSETVQTIHLVWKYILKFKRDLGEAERDRGTSIMHRVLAKSALVALEHKLKQGFITTAHKIGAFLNPRTRHLRHLSDEEKEQAIIRLNGTTNWQN